LSKPIEFGGLLKYYVTFRNCGCLSFRCRTSSSYYDSGNNNLGTSIDPYALPYVNTSHSFNHRPQSACAWKQQPAAFSSFASTAPPVVSPERQAYGNERQYNRCWGVVQGHQRQQQQHASSTTSNMRFVSPSPGGTVQKTSPESSFSAPRFWRLQQWFRRETPLQQQSLQLSTSRTAVAAVTSQYTRAKYWQASNGRDFGCRTSNYSAFDEMQQSTPCSLLPDCDHQMHRDGLYVGQNVQSRPTEKLD
jgi:hypothetical protein